LAQAKSKKKEWLSAGSTKKEGKDHRGVVPRLTTRSRGPIAEGVRTKPPQGGPRAARRGGDMGKVELLCEKKRVEW